MKETELKPFSQICNYFPLHIRNVLNKLPDFVRLHAQEIRLRVNQRIVITYSSNGTSRCTVSTVTSSKNINETFQNICNYSVYSFQNQIKEGFITLSGGHRVGICGEAVFDKGKVANIRGISSLNFRIAREFKGVSHKVLKLCNFGTKNFLIAGPPGSGKTTLLRDLARILSRIKKIVIVDSRGEIAACKNGEPQLDIGYSDILTGFEKDVGILQAIRTLNPDVVICDEIGHFSDITAINECAHMGVSVIASIHAKKPNDLMRRKQVKNFLKNSNFSSYFLMR